MTSKRMNNESEKHLEEMVDLCSEMNNRTNSVTTKKRSIDNMDEKDVIEYKGRKQQKLNEKERKKIEYETDEDDEDYNEEEQDDDDEEEEDTNEEETGENDNKKEKEKERIRIRRGESYEEQNRLDMIDMWFNHDEDFNDDQTPYIYTNGDGFAVDVHLDRGGDTLDTTLMESRNRNRCIFARHIQTYKNGSNVSKHCKPWGHNNILHNDDFIIKQKFFNCNGELSSIIIQNTDSGCDIMLTEKFFYGWTDDKTGADWFEYHTAKDTVK